MSLDGGHQRVRRRDRREVRNRPGNGALVNQYEALGVKVLAKLNCVTVFVCF